MAYLTFIGLAAAAVILFSTISYISVILKHRRWRKDHGLVPPKPVKRAMWRITTIEGPRTVMNITKEERDAIHDSIVESMEKRKKVKR